MMKKRAVRASTSAQPGKESKATPRGRCAAISYDTKKRAVRASASAQPGKESKATPRGRCTAISYDMKKIALILLMLCLLIPGALARSDAALMPVSALIPVAMTPVHSFEPVPLYCGPTQGFYRRAQQTIDLTQPFVCFGEADSWSMVAQGTPDEFGPVGWIEGGLFDADGVGELTFEDGFAAMVEETAALTDDPQHLQNMWGLSLSYGTPITVLSGYGDFLYVQSELDGTPVRAFIPVSAVY